MQATSVCNAPPKQRMGAWEWISSGAIVVLLIVLYAGVVWELGRAWLNEVGASHGVLIPPLVALIVWMERERIFAVPVQCDSRGLWLLLPASVLYLVGRLAAEFFVTRMSLIVYLAAFVWTFWGKARLAVLTFPILLLATMIPIPQLVYKTLSGPLQLLASTMATNVAQAVGVTVYQDGNIIHLAGTTLGVEEACSGMHSISALMIGSLLIGFLYLRRSSFRAVLFFSAFPIAIASNVIRVSGTAILADYWEQIAMGFYHYFSGWLVFLCALTMLVGVTKALQKLEGKVA